MGNQDNDNHKSNRTAAYIFVALALALLTFAVLPIATVAFGSGANDTTVPISRVVEQVKAGEVASISVPQEGNEIVIHYKDSTQARSIKEAGALAQYFERAGVSTQSMPNIQVQTPPSNGILNLLGPLVPMFVLMAVVLGLVFLFSRKRPSAGGADQTGQAMQFARSRAKVIIADRPTTTFGDVAGADEAKEELAEVVDFLKHPEKYAALGARIPKGLLMVGPPGTGK
ncbi:MAG: hypothetical protein ACYC4L_09795, partial [Chloroflexota bacterium]